MMLNKIWYFRIALLFLVMLLLGLLSLGMEDQEHKAEFMRQCFADHRTRSDCEMIWGHQ